MQKDSYIIRSPKDPSEWDQVRELLKDYRREFNDDICFSSFEEEMSHIEALYARPGNIKLIAVPESGGKIAGCVALQPFDEETVEMKRLYVDPGHRGQHLGKALAERVMDIAIQSGYKHIYLDTMKEMVSAQQLYAQLGFAIIPPYNDQDTSRLICYGKSINA